MIIKFSIKQNMRNYSVEHNLPEYYNFDAVKRDLEHVLEFYELKYEKWKNEYIESFGQEYWDKITKEKKDDSKS
jgi:hypothetical protein